MGTHSNSRATVDWLIGTIAIKRIILNKRILPVIMYQLFSAYSCYTCQTCRLFVSYEDGTSRSTVPWMANRPTNRRERPAPEGTQQNGHRFCLACKLKALANSRESYSLADMETSDNTLDQVHSIFVRYTCRACHGFDK